MRKQDWVWMGHAAHYCGRNECLFHLATYVGGFIVSSVGDYRPGGILRERKNVWPGYDYETMVFTAEIAEGQEDTCCPWRIGGDVAVARTNDSGEALRNHMRLCEEYAAKDDAVRELEAEILSPSDTELILGAIREVKNLAKKIATATGAN